MKFKIFFSAIILLALTQSVSAQKGSQKKPERAAYALAEPFSILMQLEPVMLNKGPEFNKTHSGEIFSFEVSKTKRSFPGLISTKTIWNEKGKNHLVATGMETLNSEQLIPVMVAAIQQQKKDIEELQLKLERLLKQSDIDHIVIEETAISH